MVDFDQMSPAKRVRYIEKLKYRLRYEYLVTNEAERNQVINDYSRVKSGEVRREAQLGKATVPFCIAILLMAIIENVSIYPI